MERDPNVEKVKAEKESDRLVVSNLEPTSRRGLTTVCKS